MKPSRIRKVLVVVKSTFRREYPQSILSSQRDHLKTVKRVCDVLDASGVQLRVANQRRNPSPVGFDLVITVGGDGTFLRASHRVKRQLMLGVNSSPSHSVGALLSVGPDQFEGKWHQIMGGAVTIRKRSRLAIWINGKRQRLMALNDILFSNRVPSATSRYLIRVSGHQEVQKSSGVWISTASGSTAAIRAAGGRVLSPYLDSIQYIVREPLQLMGIAYRLKHGILKGGSSLHLENQMFKASLFVDGTHGQCKLRLGDRVRICLSSLPLRVIL